MDDGAEAAFFATAFGGADDSDDADAEELRISEPTTSSMTKYSSVQNTRSRRRNVPDPRSGFVGLPNQGATCYLNSLIQALFFTPEIRHGLYDLLDDELGTQHLEEADQLLEKISSKKVIITDEDIDNVHAMGFSRGRARRALAKANGDLNQAIELLTNDEVPSVRRVPITLRRFFAKLQAGDQKSLPTKEITRSFGWENNEVYQQHDVHELHRILLDAMERSLKDTSQSNLVNDVFQGRMVNRVYCIKCGYTSLREEDWLDILVDVKGIRGLNESLGSLVKPEYLIRDNRYFCEKCNAKSDAKRSTAFRSLPPVLNVSLKRFDLDLYTLQRKKLTDRFVFPIILDMDPFMEKNLTEQVSRTEEDDKLLQEAQQEAIRDEAIRAKQKEAQSRRNGGNNNGGSRQRNTPGGGGASGGGSQIPDTIEEKDEEDREGYEADPEMNEVDEKVEYGGSGGLEALGGDPGVREAGPEPPDIISSQHPAGQETADISDVARTAAGGAGAIELGDASRMGMEIDQSGLGVVGHAIESSGDREGSNDSTRVAYQEQSYNDGDRDRAPYPAAEHRVTFEGTDLFPSTFDEEDEMLAQALQMSLMESGGGGGGANAGASSAATTSNVDDRTPLLGAAQSVVDQFDPLRAPRQPRTPVPDMKPRQMVKLRSDACVDRHPGGSPPELTFDRAKEMLENATNEMGEGRKFFGFYDERCASWRIGSLEMVQPKTQNVVIRLQPCDDSIEYPPNRQVVDEDDNKISLNWLNIKKFPTTFISDHPNFSGPIYQDTVRSGYKAEDDDERAADEDDEETTDPIVEEPNEYAERTDYQVNEVIGYRFADNYVACATVTRTHSKEMKVFLQFDDEYAKSFFHNEKKYGWFEIPNPNFCARPPPGSSTKRNMLRAAPTRALPAPTGNMTSPSAFHGTAHWTGSSWPVGSRSSHTSYYYNLEESKYDPNSENLYVLHAVVIHSGTPYGGHYHIYIKDIMNEGPQKIGGLEDTKEEDDEKGGLNLGKHLWYDFNDSYVSHIPEHHLARQYGNSSESAYMLIYRRYEKDSGPIPRIDLSDTLRQYVEEYNEEIRKDRVEMENERNRMVFRIIKPHLFWSRPGQLSAEPFAEQLLKHIRSVAVSKDFKSSGSRAAESSSHVVDGDILMSANPLAVPQGSVNETSLSNLSDIPALEPDDDVGNTLADELAEASTATDAATDDVDVWNENDEYLQKSSVKGLYTMDLEQCAVDFIARNSYSITVDGRAPLSYLVDRIRELLDEEECMLDVSSVDLMLHEFRFGRSLFGNIQHIRDFRTMNVGINIQPENLFESWTKMADYDLKEMERDVKENGEAEDGQPGESGRFQPRPIHSISPRPQLLFAWDGRQLNGVPFDLKSVRTEVFRVRYYLPSKNRVRAEPEDTDEENPVPVLFDDEDAVIDAANVVQEDVRGLDASDDDAGNEDEAEYISKEVSVPVSCSMKEMWEYIRRAFELDDSFVPFFTLTSDRSHEECKKFDWRDVLQDDGEKFSWTDRRDFVADLSRGRVNTRPLQDDRDQTAGNGVGGAGDGGEESGGVGTYPPRSGRRRPGTPTTSEGWDGMGFGGNNRSALHGIRSFEAGFRYHSDFTNAPTINFENAHDLEPNTVSKAQADWTNRTQNITILIEDNTRERYDAKIERLRRPKGIHGDDLLPAIRKLLNIPPKVDVVMWKRERSIPKTVVRSMHAIYSDCTIIVELGKIPTHSTECYIFVCVCMDDGGPTNFRPLLVVRHDPVAAIKRQILDRFHMQEENEKDYVLYRVHNGTKHYAVKEVPAISQTTYIYDGTEMWLEKGPFPQETKTIHVSVVRDTRNLEVPWSDSTSVASNYEYGQSVYVSQQCGMSTVNQNCTYDELRKHISRMKDLQHVQFNHLRVNYFDPILSIPVSVPVLHSGSLKNQKKWSSLTRGGDICVEVLDEPLEQVSKWARFLNTVLVRRLQTEGGEKGEEVAEETEQDQGEEPMGNGEAAATEEASKDVARGLEFWPNDAPVRLFFDPNQRCLSWAMLKQFYAEKYNLNADLVVGGAFKAKSNRWDPFTYDQDESQEGLAGDPWFLKGATDMTVVGIMECASPEDVARESELIADWNPPPVSEKARKQQNNRLTSVGFYGLDNFDFGGSSSSRPEAQLKIDID